jgi:PAS domain S-box-containing protein
MTLQERALNIGSSGVAVEKDDTTRRTDALRYQALFAHAPDGILIADAQGRYLDANPSICRMLGYARDELVGLDATHIVAAAEVGQIDLALDAIKTGLEYYREWQFRRKDGTVLSAEVFATQMPDGSLLAMVRDISERRQAALVSTRLAAIVESSDDAIVGQDLNSIVTSWNLGAERIFGYGAHETVGTSLLRLIPADRQHEEHLFLERVRQGEKLSQFHSLRLTRDGRTIDVSITASPIVDATGKAVGISKVIRDITALKAHEREIERVSRLYAALSQVNQAIVQSRSQDDLFAAVCNMLTDVGEFRMVWIGWHDPASRQIVPVAGHGEADAYIRAIKVYADERPEGCGPVGTSFRSGRRAVCNDMLNDPAMSPWHDEIEHYGFHACAAFPIRQNGIVVGTLNVYSAQTGFFQDKEIALLDEAADDISFALDNFAREDLREQAERAAQSERQFSQTMIESMPGILYFYTAEGRFLRWNRNFETVSGYSAADIGIMHPLDFFLPEDRAQLEQRIGDVFETGESSVEASFLTQDGRTIPHYFTGRRVEFEGQACLVGMGIDISARLRYERELEQSQARLEVVVENLREGLVITDHDGELLRWNPEALRLLGFSDLDEGRRLQHDFARIFSLHTLAGDVLTPTQWPLARVRRGEVVADFQAIVRRIGTGWERVFSYSGLRVDYGDGQTLAFVTLQDITERIRADAALRDSRDELERQVTARTLDLRAALVRAEAADRIKSAFLATMSHELRTPLNSIIGFTGILLQNLAGPLNAEQGKQLGMVQGSARHLLELINDVLDISKIEADQLEVRADAFDLAAALERVTASVRPLAQKKALALEMSFAAASDAMNSDRRRIEQILINLLSNAIKFTEHGRVSLVVDSVADYRVKPDAAPCAALRFQVSDSGMGIKAEHLAVLFQPFRQIDAGLSRQHEGTGLGLAICCRLARLLGGDITVASEWGKGSTFTAMIPQSLPPR